MNAVELQALLEQVARGDIANLYEHERGLLKLARDPADNDLLDREAAALTRLPNTRFVNPGTAFGSYTSVGTPSITAASIIGPLA